MLGTVVDSSSVSPEIAELVAAVNRREERGPVMRREEPQVQLVVCLLDGQYYAFYGDVIQEIIPVPTITFVPGVPAWLPGVMHVRGTIESVLDVRQALGMAAARVTAQSRIALGQVGELRSGLLVDSVEDVLEIPQDTLRTRAANGDGAGMTFVAAETEYDGHPLLVLDLDALFTALLAGCTINSW